MISPISTNCSDAMPKTIAATGSGLFRYQSPVNIPLTTMINRLSMLNIQCTAAAPPKIYIGRVLYLVMNVTVIRSSTTLIARHSPYLDLPWMRARWLTLRSTIRAPAAFASTGMKRCISPYSRTWSSTSRR